MNNLTHKQNDWLIGGGLAGLHLLIALFCWVVLDFESSNAWGGGTMQLVEMDALQARPLENLWYLHSQPPLYNLIGWFWGWLTPAYYPQAIWGMNIVMGTLICGMSYLIARYFMGRWLSVAIVLLYGVINPALLLFEPIEIYTIPTSFLLTLAVWFLTRYRGERNSYLYAFLGCLVLAMLMRSLIHIILLIVFIPLVIFWAKENRRRVAIVALIIALPVTVWYGKNAVLFGFFGSSSWSGSNLWKIAEVAYADDTLDQLADEGVLDAIVSEQVVFSFPSDYVRYGFDEQSSVSALTRNDFNNLNIIAVSEVYGDNAIRLIQYNPFLYVRSVYNAYKIFVMPTHSFITEQLYTRTNRVKIDRYTTFHEQVIQGVWLTDTAERLLNEEFTAPLMFLLPLSVAIFVLQALWQCRLSWRRWVDFIQDERVAITMCGLIVYVTLVSALFEYGENNRFKLLIEPILWVFVASQIRQLFSRKNNVGDDTITHEKVD